MRLTALGIMLLLLAGCTSTLGARKLEENLPLLKKGADKSEVLALFGNPQNVERNPEKAETLTYELVRERIRNRPFSPSRVERKIKRLTVEIGSDGKVADFYVDELYAEQGYYPSATVVSNSRSNSVTPSTSTMPSYNPLGSKY